MKNISILLSLMLCFGNVSGATTTGSALKDAINLVCYMDSKPIKEFSANEKLKQLMLFKINLPDEKIPSGTVSIFSTHPAPAFDGLIDDYVGYTAQKNAIFTSDSIITTIGTINRKTLIWAATPIDNEVREAPCEIVSYYKMTAIEFFKREYFNILKSETEKDNQI